MNEIRRIRRENPSLQLNLSEDTLLIFLLETNGVSSVNLANSFKDSLQEYINNSLRKLTTLEGEWVNENALMVNTVIEERFIVANLIKQSNL